jgi:hypothetical protein
MLLIAHTVQGVLCVAVELHRSCCLISGDFHVLNNARAASAASSYVMAYKTWTPHSEEEV